MLGHRAHGFDRARIERTGRVFGHEAAMGLHLIYTEQSGKVRRLAQRVDTRSAVLRRNQPDGGGALRKVPFQRQGANYLDSCGRQFILGQQLAKLRRQLGSEFVEVAVQRKKAVAEPHIVHALEGCLRGSERTDEQA
jgi:hypothetical protein